MRAIPDGPGKRVAELQGLDKVTARTQRFYAPVGQATRFGTLDINVGDCLVNTPDAPPESAAYLTIVDHKPGQPEQKLFAGWMFASTPALSALDDGVYDVRVLACTMANGILAAQLALKARGPVDRVGELYPELLARHLDRAEAAQVLGHELAVEQAKAALDQPRHEMDQRDLGRIALAAEHALAEERRADRDAIEAADQLALAPAFDAVRMAAREQLAVERQDRLVDPALGMAGPRLGAGPHHAGEIGVGADLEDVLPHGARQTLGQVEAVERQHRAQPGIEPVELGIVAALAHREDADAIGLQQQLGRDLEHAVAYFFRPTSFSSQWML